MGGGGGGAIHELVEGETREWGMMGWKGWEVRVLIKGWEMGEIMQRCLIFHNQSRGPKDAKKKRGRSQE